MPVGEMLSRMSSLEFAEWQEYWKVEAYGPHVQEIQLARLSYIMAQAWCSDPKKGNQFSLSDFLLSEELTSKNMRKQQTWEEQLEIVKMLATATGTKVTQGNN
jgi:hypothetical protein